MLEQSGGGRPVQHPVAPPAATTNTLRAKHVSELPHYLHTELPSHHQRLVPVRAGADPGGAAAVRGAALAPPHQHSGQGCDKLGEEN